MNLHTNLDLTPNPEKSPKKVAETPKNHKTAKNYSLFLYLYNAIKKMETIKMPSSQPQMLSSSPKPQSPRTCHIKKVCTFQVQQKKKKSVLGQDGSKDTER